MHLKIRNRLADAYAEILSPELLENFNGKEDGLAGVFLPSALDEPMSLMIVGMETKQWNGSFSKLHDGDLRSYIESSMDLHRSYINKSAKNSSFGRFHSKAAKELRCTRGQIGWGNLLAVSHKMKSPVDSDAFPVIQDLSAKLLRAQLKIMQPKAVIFVCGWRYDNYLKNTLEGIISNSKVIESKALWRFEVGEAVCYRTSHPRYAKGEKFRNQALVDIRQRLAVI